MSGDLDEMVADYEVLDEMALREDCWSCGGEGWVSRHDEDPLWYDEDDLYPCEVCGGVGWL